jgi:pimeloyl-ACP methyl ester carboxylesterase
MGGVCRSSLAGEAVAQRARLAQLAAQATVFHRLGAEAAVEMARRRSGTALDPGLAEAFSATAPACAPRSTPAIRRMPFLAAEPEPPRSIDDAEIDSIAHAFADAVDLESLRKMGRTPDAPGAGGALSFLPYATPARMESGREEDPMPVSRSVSFAATLALPALLWTGASWNPASLEVSMMMNTVRESVGGARQPYQMPVRVLGEGPPLALIGGGLTGWRSWEPHAERLAATRTVALLQLLGVQYGLEDRRLPEDYSVRIESAALAGALDDLGWQAPLDLVAWSYGALITLDFALTHPERVRTLTLIEPPAVWVLPDRERTDPDLQALETLARTIGDEVGEADLERFVCTVGLCPPGIMPQELPQWPLWMEHRRSLRTGTSATDHRDDLARLRGLARPVLLVTGTGTAPFLRRIHDQLAVHLPQARTTEMPAGHAPQIVSMDRFLAELARFHASLEVTPGPPRRDEEVR